MHFPVFRCSTQREGHSVEVSIMRLLLSQPCLLIEKIELLKTMGEIMKHMFSHDAISYSFTSPLPFEILLCMQLENFSLLYTCITMHIAPGGISALSGIMDVDLSADKPAYEEWKFGNQKCSAACIWTIYFSSFSC